MATFKTIADTDLASGAAISQSTMQALKDNITACFEGDVSSPQLLPSALGSATSDIGEENHFCVASITGHAVAGNDHLLQIDIRKTGSYILHYVARINEINPNESGDGNVFNTSYTYKLQKASSGSSSFSDIADTTKTLSTTNQDAGVETNTHMDKEISLTAGDQIRLHVNENVTGGTSVTFKVFIENNASFFSNTAIGIMTEI